MDYKVKEMRILMEFFGLKMSIKCKCNSSIFLLLLLLIIGMTHKRAEDGEELGHFVNI